MFEEFNNMVKDVCTWGIAFAACLLISAVFVVALKVIIKVISFAWNLV